MKDYKVNVAFQLPSSQLEWIDSVAETSGVPRSQAIRELLELAHKTMAPKGKRGRPRTKLPAGENGEMPVAAAPKKRGRPRKEA